LATASSTYRTGARKKIHIRYGEESLEVKCLRDGTLDVDIETGEVFSIDKNGKRTKRRLAPDDDGYLGFHLARERKSKRGKPCRWKEPGRADRVRYRNRRYVMVHRLVKIKALAVAKGGRNWTQYVRDLPLGIDVNHLGPKTDNRHTELELQTEAANRSRTEMTDAEWQALQDVF
jgi:hypothetical protein